jgi:NAD(P)H-nitrite reductase large subunit
MAHHVIIGGGPAATNALETLREFDTDARITLICDEPAHSRMALPYWLADQIPREHTLTADADYFHQLNVDARIGSRVANIDAQAKQLTLTDGSNVGFDKLLIATGSGAAGLSIPGAELDGVQTLWTLADTETALATVQGKERPRVLLIGSGFIGFIVLNAMYKRGWQLTVVEREKHVLPRMLNADAAELVQDWLSSRGVSLHTATTVQSIEQRGDGKHVTLANGAGIDVDLVIIATGVKPNLDCVQGSAIEIDQGILVNERMQTSCADIYAAGDVAQGPVLFSSTRQIHAIQPTAIDHGRIAAANMAGREVSYPGSLSMNVLDVCGLQCASYGNWDDSSAQAMTISNESNHIYRNLLWTGDEISGALFVGHANDLGMLTDVGMVKGLMQTRTALGPWQDYLAENPFDIRRPYVASKVAQQLAQTTLLGRPANSRRYRFQGRNPQAAVDQAHASYVGHAGT